MRGVVFVLDESSCSVNDTAARSGQKRKKLRFEKSLRIRMRICGDFWRYVASNDESAQKSAEFRMYNVRRSVFYDDIIVCKKGESSLKNATYDFTEDILIVNLCGEIDHHNAAVIRREIDESMTAFHAKNLILDYSDVSFMDSSGIGLAMGRYNRVKELDGSIVIVPGTPYISRILGLSGLSGSFRRRRQSRRL